MNTTSESGRNWAYAGIIVGFAVSITANVTSTVLTGENVPLWLRIPFASIWPILTYIAIEVIARTDWADVQSLTARGIKAILWIPVGFVAAFVSYLHQHELMRLASEPGLAQAFGPLAVDGLLFGCTATLIVSRRKTDAMPVPISPAAPRAPRAPRSAWDAGKVIDMILEGAKDSEISSETKISPASLGRFKKVIRTLRANPNATIGQGEKVRPEYVDMIRKAIAR